jgi:hypothetical protein
MAEIKSTLDLVMEKTKNLSLSSEERQQQKTLEIENRIKGLLQKFQDRSLSIDQLKVEYGRLVKDNHLTDNTLLLNQIVDRLDLNKDNHLLLALLTDMCDADTQEIESVLNEFQEAIRSAASHRMLELKENFAQKHAIAGSAVVPNLQADETWQAEVSDMRAIFEQKLDEQKGKLGCS